MTQAFNLAQLANKVNSAGRLAADTGLVNATPVANGGTGATTLVLNNVLLGNGTSAVQTVAPGATGNLLASNGTTWASAAPAAPAAPTTAQVLTATAAASVGAVGTYAFLTRTYFTSFTNNPGDTLAGASLRYSGAGYVGGNPAGGISGTAPAGTWRCMGFMQGTTDACNFVVVYTGTIWLRIS